MSAYYNEIDPYCVEWLRRLMLFGYIPEGDVDDRSIVDVRPDDLRGYTQAHFFAGLGGWPLAARLAGWPDDRPLWTGSCPCQPFSVAGKGHGHADERHLWPVWHGLIRECRPPVVMGEQVDAAIGKSWLDGVFADLEGSGYACGAAVLPACAVGAPHRRSRLWFVADAARGGRRERGPGLRGPGEGPGAHPERPAGEPLGRGLDGLADADAPGLSVSEREAALGAGRGIEGRAAAERGGACGPGAVGDPDLEGRLQQGRPLGQERGWAGHAGAGGPVADADGAGIRVEPRGLGGTGGSAGATWDPWAGAEWILGADGKARRVGAGVRLLAHGVPQRVAKLRALGNAIVPQVAAEAIAAYMEVVS